MKEIKKRLGFRIKELRSFLGLTQQELADIAEIDKKTLSKIECGYNFPVQSLDKIAEALKVTLPQLFDFEHINSSEENMKKYIIENLEYLQSHDITIIYRLIKSMR